MLIAPSALSQQTMHSSKVQEHKHQCAVCAVNPSRAKSGFEFYQSDPLVRQAVWAKHPGWKWDSHDDLIPDVSKELWARWSAMDAAARQPYVEQSEAEKALLATRTGNVLL